MKKNFALIAAAALLAVSLSACGDTASSDANDSVAAVASENSTDSVVSEATDNSQDDVTESDSTDASKTETSETDSSADSTQTEETQEIEGYFLEKLDGEDNAYIVITDSSSYIIPLGSVTGEPLFIVQDDEGFKLNRGGISSDETTSNFSYDGETVLFEQGGHSYEWDKLDCIPLEGSFNQVDDEGTILTEWEFVANGTSLVGGRTFIYTQGTDTLDITYDDGETASYGYYYDVISLKLTASDGTVLDLRAVGS